MGGFQSGGRSAHKVAPKWVSPPAGAGPAGFYARVCVAPAICCTHKNKWNAVFRHYLTLQAQTHKRTNENAQTKTHKRKRSKQMERGFSPLLNPAGTNAQTHKRKRSKQMERGFLPLLNPAGTNAQTHKRKRTKQMERGI